MLASITFVGMKKLEVKNGPSPASFSFIFRLFETNINTVLQQINVKKCPSNKRCWNLNPQPSEHESPPITTRPGLPSKKLEVRRAFYSTKK